MSRKSVQDAQLLRMRTARYSLYPGGGTKPPTSLASRSAKLIGVASSQNGPMIWIPTGSPCGVRPTGATVAGQPVSVAGAIQLSMRSEEHTSELQSHSFISYAVFC